MCAGRDNANQCRGSHLHPSEWMIHSDHNLKLVTKSRNQTLVEVNLRKILILKWWSKLYNQHAISKTYNLNNKIKLRNKCPKRQGRQLTNKKCKKVHISKQQIKSIKSKQLSSFAHTQPTSHTSLIMKRTVKHWITNTNIARALTKETNHSVDKWAIHLNQSSISKSSIRSKSKSKVLKKWLTKR